MGILSRLRERASKAAAAARAAAARARAAASDLAAAIREQRQKRERRAAPPPDDEPRERPRRRAAPTPEPPPEPPPLSPEPPRQPSRPVLDSTALDDLRAVADWTPRTGELIQDERFKVVEPSQANRWVGFVVEVDPATGAVNVRGQTRHMVSKNKCDIDCADLADRYELAQGGGNLYPVVLPIVWLGPEGAEDVGPAGDVE